MGMFRCVCCTDEKGRPGRDFEAAKPVCPDCGADGDHVLVVELIHLDPPSGRPGRGLRHAACNPKITINATGKVRMSGEASAVTCKACKATAVWKVLAGSGEPSVPEANDFVVGEKGQ